MEEEVVTAPAEAEVVSEAPQEAAEPSKEPEAQAKPAPSRKEALEKAFKQVDEPKKEPETAEKPAKKEAPKEEKAEAKAPERDESGKFKAKTDSEPPKGEKRDIDAAPSRFTGDAKAEWATVSPSVRGEVTRAISELEAGIADKDSQLAPLKPYLDMASKHGVRLEQALQRYTSLEGLLSHDPTAGLQQIAANMGLSPQDAAALMLGQGSKNQDPRDQKIMSLERQLQGVQQGMQSQKQETAMQQVQDFASKHEHFEALSQDIVFILNNAPETSLEDAYKQALSRAQNLAERFKPAAETPQAEAPVTPAQTRVSQSVTGAPTAGSNPANRKPSTTRIGALQRAAAQAGL